AGHNCPVHYPALSYRSLLTRPSAQQHSIPRTIDTQRTDVLLFTNTAPTEIYTLSLHDALPISAAPGGPGGMPGQASAPPGPAYQIGRDTSELQSLAYLVCRLLLEKKKKREASAELRHRRSRLSRRESRG